MKTYVLNNKRLTDRIDVQFYDPEYFQTIKLLSDTAKSDEDYEIAEIRNILSKKEKDITSGATPLGATYLEEGIPFIRVQNVRKNRLKLSNVKFIPKFIHEGDLKRSQLKPDDVLLTITGMTYGLSAIVPEDLKEANMNQHSVRIRVDTGKIFPKLLSMFLNSKLGKIQSDRFVTGSTRPALDYEAVRSIKILFPKSHAKQEQIVKETEKYLKIAYAKRSEFKKELFKCISLISDKLGVEIKEHKVQTFILNTEGKTLNRLDCYSHSPAYRKIISGLKNAEKNKKCDLMKGNDLSIMTDKISMEKNRSHVYRYIDIGNTEKELGSIQGHQEDVLINLPSRARQIIRENDILLPRPIGSTEGIIIVPKKYDGQLASTGFIQIRPKNHDEAVLLWAILKSSAVQEQLFYLQSGSLQPEITPKVFMKRVLIPFPNDKIKEDIIKQIKESFIKLQELQKEQTKNTELADEIFVDALLKV